MSSTKSVKIYSLSTWPTCKKAKRFLEKNDIAYENLDVGESEEAREEMVQKSGQLGVPVIDIDGEIIIGFDKESIKHKLNL